MSKICFNGLFLDADAPVITAANRGYRYGDGFFETIRVVNNTIPLIVYHKSRIESTVSLLDYSLPNTNNIDTIFEKVLELCSKNNCSNNARVRISFSNGDGSLFDSPTPLHYLVETWPLKDNSYTFNEAGLEVGIFESIKKSTDKYANIKSSSALLYSVAMRFAKKKIWDDAVILNQKDNIIESTIANIFWIKHKSIFTPPLSEGCVNGVMRRFLMEKLSVVEKYGTLNDLQNADEIFLTNAVRGIRWVKGFNQSRFTNKVAFQIFETFLSKID